MVLAKPVRLLQQPVGLIVSRGGIQSLTGTIQVHPVKWQDRQGGVGWGELTVKVFRRFMVFFECTQ